ncbi:peptide ABC transporter substrate-binding protein [Altericroceibacterium spongiae]|uniref:Peptide ABC transporter substrate-binding protein n=1 Tax=Altericroceibacterium spongiae TaxID=2320269 RepID=A0A420EIQ7_9SPHN|nr:ABC transporter substrate-binding protein [Altericroceibacterium spongiae]RKF20599.1 peptide ABC transporter substrate-binding protein [Altericroceibacterium spongiae]
MVPARILMLCCAFLAITGCKEKQSGPVTVAFPTSAEALYAKGLQLTPPARYLRGATESGLVGLDRNGEVIPAIADRWIVTEDGMSYIFRLRDGKWPDGSAITARSVRQSLRQTLRALTGTELGLDTAQISQVRAMAERVIEIRLSSPMPDFLQLLAQPEFAIRRESGSMGLMTMTRKDDEAVLLLRPPEELGLPLDGKWAQHNRPVHIVPLTAKDAIERFKNGAVDLVVDGRLGSLPLTDMGPLARGTLQLDPALGLFGLQIRHEKGFLAEPEGREALSLALDRNRLREALNLAGWIPTTRIVAAGLQGDLGTIGERWADISMEERREEAALRVAAWKASVRSELDRTEAEVSADMAKEDKENTPLQLRMTVFLPEGPGYDMLLDALGSQYAEIGITLVRAPDAQAADMVLVDNVARYAGARWFLNQFNCRLKRGLCSAEADQRVAEAMTATDSGERSALLTEAEAELTSANAYIPLGSPIRWSLVRGRQEGFAVNRWAFHPLPELATLPN